MSPFFPEGFMVHYLLIYVALQKSSLTNILPEQQSIVLQTRREKNHRDNEISGGSLRRLEKLKMIAKTRIKRNTKKKYKYLEGYRTRNQNSVTSYTWKMRVIHSTIMKHTYHYRKVSPGDCPEVFTCRKHMTVRMNQSCVN